MSLHVWHPSIFDRKINLQANKILPEINCGLKSANLFTCTVSCICIGIASFGIMFRPITQIRMTSLQPFGSGLVSDFAFVAECKITTWWQAPRFELWDGQSVWACGSIQSQFEGGRLANRIDRFGRRTAISLVLLPHHRHSYTYTHTRMPVTS